MTRPVRSVKKEIRILGIDECSPDRTVGVIVRGGLYIDGVVGFPRDLKNASIGLARKIVESAYFPELRAVMLHDLCDEPDSASVEKITNLPTVAISENKPHGRAYSSLEGNLGRIWVGTRIEMTVLKKIVAACWTVGKLPEPLRLAHLLAKQYLSESSG
jgi:endonuclease V-like protein UPF0215 family